MPGSCPTARAYRILDNKSVTNRVTKLAAGKHKEMTSNVGYKSISIVYIFCNLEKGDSFTFRDISLKGEAGGRSVCVGKMMPEMPRR